MLRNIIPVSGLLISTFLLLSGSGLSGIVIPLRAGSEGWTPTMIGWMGFSYAACFLAGCFLVPRMVRRVGHVRVYAVLAAILSMAMMAHSLLVTVPSWFLFRGLAGFALAGTYMVVESWLNEQTPNESRGLVFSAYMVTNTAGLMLGQFLLIAGDPQTHVLFVLAAMLYASAVIPTGLSNATSPKPLAEVKLNLGSLFRTSPIAFVGSITTGFVWGAWNFQSAVYGSMAGLSDGQIATMLVTAMIGGTVLQFPLGRASDKTDRRHIMILCAVLGILISGVFIVLEPTRPTVLLPMMFLFGGVLMPLYSIVVAHANDHAKPGAFVETSSGLLMVYGVGSMAGPVLAGFLMTGMGRSGFFVTAIVAYVLFGAYAAWRMTRTAAPSQEDRNEFAVTPVGRNQTPEVFQLDPRADEN